jgi:hypothetical protein
MMMCMSSASGGWLRMPVRSGPTCAPSREDEAAVLRVGREREDGLVFLKHFLPVAAPEALENFRGASADGIVAMLHQLIPPQRVDAHGEDLAGLERVEQRRQQPGLAHRGGEHGLAGAAVAIC